ncbi:MAG: hypothetical protein S4CHLAM6_05130 [Chlamydiae bacterium]|nr:hypothetical protein [Chlamydiota bacterium]
MFLKIFTQKSVGFSIHKQTVKYALITRKRNKLFVEESLVFKVNCKTALHRLQHLLSLYPSSFWIGPEKFFLTSGPEDIKSAKDRKQVVKNKIESLLSSEEIQLCSQDCCSVATTPFFCVRTSQMKQIQEKLKSLKLNPQKIVTSSQALLSICSFFKKGEKNILLHFFNKKIELLSLSGNKLLTSQAFSTDSLNSSQVVKKVLNQIFLLSSEKKTSQLSIYGLKQKHSELLDAIEKIPNLKLRKKANEGFEASHPEFLAEIGAATGLFKLFKHNFQKATLTRAWQIYKHPLLTHLPLILATFSISLFSWSIKTKRVQAQNKEILTRSFTKLEGRPPKEFELGDKEQLSKSLSNQQKKSPPIRLKSICFSVSETLAWITDLFNKVSLDYPSPFIIENFKYGHGKNRSNKKNLFTHPIQINLSFSASSSLVARKVYDEICKSKQFVDTSKNISWNYQNNQYHVVFFLKNKPLEKL